MEQLIQVIGFASKIFSLLILARVVLSWVGPAADNSLTRFVYAVTEPVLGPVRSLLPNMGGMDFSPILVLIGLQILEQLLVRALIGLAM
jgi:YggT family protein